MGILQDVRLLAHRRSLRKLVRQRATPPGRGKINLKSAESIGILFDATELSARDVILEYAEKLRRQGKRMRLLGYFDDLTDSENYAFKFFNRKQFDWALRPNSEEVAAFIKEDFDLLLNIDPVSKLHSEYIAALSKAKLRVGPYTEQTYCYDLMIDLPPHASLRQFIEQAESLLGKTNIQHETAPI